MPTADAKTYFFRAAILRQVFQNVDPPYENPAFGYGWGAWGAMAISLHTADPGEGGDQTTNEVAGGWYARQTLARSTAGWTVDATDPANPFATNKLAAVWGKNTSGVPVGPVTHIGLGRESVGAGRLLYSIPLSTPLSIPANGTFALSAGQIQVWER